MLVFSFNNNVVQKIFTKFLSDTQFQRLLLLENTTLCGLKVYESFTC